MGCESDDAGATAAYARSGASEKEGQITEGGRENLYS